LSSHINVTAQGAWVEYHWSDFSYDPLEVLADYFDAFLYMANWGSKQIAFRFPATLIDPWPIQPYIVEPYITLTAVNEFQLLSINLFSDDPVSDWIEPEGRLASLTPLRHDTLLGDYRFLYLAWLQAVDLGGTNEIADDEPEPPVPAGLGALTAAQQAFADWIDLDSHLLACAASASPALSETASGDLEAAIGKLSRQECDDFLLRLLNNEPLLSLALRRRLQECGDSETQVSDSPRRRVTELLELRADRVQEEERRREEAERIRTIRELEDLSQREEQVWQHVEQLLATSYQPNDYDDATANLVKLRQLAVHRDTLSEFQARMDEIARRFRRRPSLMDRFRREQLL
jgi:hypothetical protein